MNRICVLITKTPDSDEEADRMFGLSQAARKKEAEVSVYLLGDGVLYAKKDRTGFPGKNIKSALENGISVKASENDLLARAMTAEHVESGVEILNNFEDIFVEDLMENADRVISW
jgi:sulfur relay protein TusB/DsrH